jgi:hypothetical protein
MIIPPSHPAGALNGPLPLRELAEPGALVGVRAVTGNTERQDEERPGSGAGVIFEASAQRPPLEIYGPDGRPVEEGQPAEEPASGGTIEAQATEGSEGSEAPAGPRAEEELSDTERQELADLRARDTEVRAHEAAHVAAGGAHVRGGASYGYRTGPDGRQYAVEGEVGIDTSPVPGDPEATAAKARQIRAAALAPAQPSGADRSIAARASQMESEAMVEMVQEQREAEAQAESAREGSPWDRYALDPAARPGVGGRLSLVA